MLVFGDHTEIRDPRALIAELCARLHGRVDPRVAHARLVGVFVDASALAQGLADAEATAHGCDARGVLGDAAMAALVTLARAIAESWRGAAPEPEIARRMLERLRAAPLPDTIRTKRAEGHAFYAVYPEAYLEAARRAALHRPQVIGLRSIGTGLAAMVAAATGAPVPSTVRPAGDAFRRALRIDDRLIAEWTADPSVAIAIVDEGPGLSGSSFGAVLDVLAGRGVRADRIACFPSHAGDLGPAASAPHRERWSRIARHVVDVDELLVRSGRLAAWIAELVGPLAGPLEDISAGAWRAVHYASEAEWPPVIAPQERRKFLARTPRGTFVARFAGLGRDAGRALDRARTLATAGFTPEVVGLAHGFLVERWLDSSTALDPRSADRRALIEHVAPYLAFRARAFPAAPERGASASALLAMARRNTELALGDASELDRWSAHALEQRMRRIEIDGKLHAWEWRCAGDRLVKTDAIDHHAAHDLVGCQDLAWDIAGAAVELALDPDEQHALLALTYRLAERTPDPELVAFARTCYVAFQLGRHALATGATPGERARLAAAVARYEAALRGELQSTAAAAARLEVR